MEEQQYDQFTFDFNNEQPEIVRDSQDALQLKIGEFAGPLDLLLFLIRQEQANIFDIPVAKITDEYLKYIKLMKKLDITVASDFLVMAAQLIEIKSRMLLPQDPKEVTEEGEVEDPREALVRQLLEHQKFKNAAEMLYERVTVERAVFPRGRIESDDINAEINATVFDLINVFQKILARQKEQIEFEIEREEISMADMMKELKRRLADFKELSVTTFFEEMRSRRELVTAFIAVLEIVRTESIRLIQSATFGDIVLKKS
jgi:segregation and condensation protein A